jgi:hypothetical protein
MSKWLSKLEPFKFLFKKGQVHELENLDREWGKLARWKKEWTCLLEDKAQLQRDWACCSEDLARLHQDSTDERKLEICRLKEDWAGWEKDWACYQESVTRLCEERACFEESFICLRKESADWNRKDANAYWKMVPWNSVKNDSEEEPEFLDNPLEIQDGFRKLFAQQKELNHREHELNNCQRSIKERQRALEDRQLILTLPTFAYEGGGDTWIQHQSILGNRAIQLSNLMQELGDRTDKIKALCLKLVRDPVVLPWLKLIRFLQKTVEKAKTVETSNDPGSYFPVMVILLDFLQSFLSDGMP